MECGKGGSPPWPLSLPLKLFLCQDEPEDTGLDRVKRVLQPLLFGRWISLCSKLHEILDSWKRFGLGCLGFCCFFICRRHPVFCISPVLLQPENSWPTTDVWWPSEPRACTAWATKKKLHPAKAPSGWKHCSFNMLGFQVSFFRIVS